MYIVDLTLKVKYLFVCLGWRPNIFLLIKGLIRVPVSYILQCINIFID